MNPSEGNGTWPPEEVVIPGRWPSAWPYLSRVVYQRGVFVVAVAVLTAAGIAAAGAPGVQWWIPLLPSLLFVGPARRAGRLRRMLERAAARGDLAAMPGRLHPGPVTSRGQTVRLVTTAGDAVRVPAFPGVAETLAVRHVGQPVTLVWAPRPFGRAPAALLVGDSWVAYLQRVPQGARSVVVPNRPGEKLPALVRARR